MLALERAQLRSVHDAIYENLSFRVGAAQKLGLSRYQVQRRLERIFREARALLEQAGIRDSNVTPDPEASTDG